MADRPSITTLRIAARIANGFALDLVRLGGFGRDVVDGLILAAVASANMAPISRDPKLQIQYATMDQWPPDELRRPVSINAIASSLRLPFETTRRRIKNLEDSGIIQATPKGLFIPAGPVNAPFYRMAMSAHYEMVAALYRRLRNLGLLRDLPERDDCPFHPDDPPVRLVTRLSREYVLRLIEPLTENIGDLVTGIIFMDVVHANTEHFGDDQGGTEQEGDAGYVPDSERRPTRAAEIAKRLGMSHETVRRHLKTLVETDRCEVVNRAYVAPARVLARPPFMRYMVDNQIHLQRLFHGLAETGVTAIWAAEERRMRLTA